MNSACFKFLVSLQLGLADVGRKHYEVGIIQRTPIPDLTHHASVPVAALPWKPDLQRDRDRDDETTRLLRPPRSSPRRAHAARRCLRLTLKPRPALPAPPPSDRD